jgi:hypothetical protein
VVAAGGAAAGGAAAAGGVGTVAAGTVAAGGAAARPAAEAVGAGAAGVSSSGSPCVRSSSNTHSHSSSSRSQRCSSSKVSSNSSSRNGRSCICCRLEFAGSFMLCLIMQHVVLMRPMSSITPLHDPHTCLRLCLRHTYTYISHEQQEARQGGPHIHLTSHMGSLAKPLPLNICFDMQSTSASRQHRSGPLLQRAPR